MPRQTFIAADHPRYKWVALSNTTLGMLMATINANIVLISLPAIFKGINLNPLEPGNVSYLLWTLMGYMLVTAVLVTTFGRLGDMYGRVKIYNYGFVVFTIGSILLSINPLTGQHGALWLIGFRLLQAVGGSMLFANSTAILTDAFPPDRRGFAMGINQVASIAGTFIGLLLGGALAVVHWRWVFLVSVPVGILGTIWSYRSLHETGQRNPGRVDWAGNLTFLLGLTALLTAITYGIQPYGHSNTGWTNPWVLSGIIGGLVVLFVFGVIELRAKQPMLDLRLFKIRAFSAGNLASLLSAIGRGGLQFMLVIWLQGIWLPLHGYSFESTPLWAGIYMLPITVGFLIAGPVSGMLSDRFGARAFASIGLLLVAATFLLYLALPMNFDYWQFGAISFLSGIGSGMFGAPNRTAIMNSLPPKERGAGSGVTGTLQNAGSSLSIGVFFSLMIVGLATSLPQSLKAGLLAHGVPAAAATQVANVPPVSSLFSALLGYNPIQTMLGGSGVLEKLKPADVTTLTGEKFFPGLVSGPFHQGLVVVFSVAAAMSVIAALASLARGQRYINDEPVAIPAASGATDTSASAVVEAASDDAASDDVASDEAGRGSLADDDADRAADGATGPVSAAAAGGADVTKAGGAA